MQRESLSLSTLRLARRSFVVHHRPRRGVPRGAPCSRVAEGDRNGNERPSRAKAALMRIGETVENLLRSISLSQARAVKLGGSLITSLTSRHPPLFHKSPAGRRGICLTRSTLELPRPFFYRGRKRDKARVSDRRGDSLNSARVSLFARLRESFATEWKERMGSGQAALS